MDPKVRTAVLTGGPRDGEIVELKNDSPVLWVPVPGQPDLIALYLRNREAWLFKDIVRAKNVMGTPPSSLRHLVAYLSLRPRVRIVMAEMFPREVSLVSYDRHRLFWSDGTYTILCMPVRTDMEMGIEFDAGGVTVQSRYLTTRIEYL